MVDNRHTFVAIVLSFDPPPPYQSAANEALGEFEMKNFAPDTPEADLYQIVLDPTFQGLTLQVVTFPEGYLPAFAESLRQRGLTLVRGTAEVFSATGAVRRYAPSAVFRELGLEFDNNFKTYVFNALGADR
jgi:hypothetical protein